MPRSLQSAILSMGMVNIPVKLYTAAKSKAVSFYWLDRDTGQRVRQQLYTERQPVSVTRLSEEFPHKAVEPVVSEHGQQSAALNSGEDERETSLPSRQQPVSRARVVKGYEIARNQYVSFTQAELKALEDEANEHAEIQEFVPVDAVDAVYFEKTYYLGPDKGSEKPYRLLARALREAGRGAIAKVVMRGKEKVVLIRPAPADRLILEVLYYADEVLNVNDIAVPNVAVSSEELRLASQIIALHATDTWQPEQYRDTYRERVLALIDQKPKETPGNPVTSRRKTPAVLDLMDALKRSLAASPKPSSRKARLPISSPKRRAHAQ